MIRHTLVAASSAAFLVLSGVAAAAESGFTCTFLGGKAGEANSEGGVDPWQGNDAEYAATDATQASAAKSARLACTDGEELGAQGCFFQGCADLAAAPATETPAAGTPATENSATEGKPVTK